MNHARVVVVDLLQVLFMKSGDFSREPTAFVDGVLDAPTFPLAIEIANEFLSRFRMLTGDFRIRKLIGTRTLAVLEYLADDGQPVAKDASKLSGAANHYANTRLNPLPPHVWDAVRTTTAATDARAWDGLLLDAVGLLPDVGPALVLAATSLETLIFRGARVLVWRAVGRSAVAMDVDQRPRRLPKGAVSPRSVRHAVESFHRSILAGRSRTLGSVAEHQGCQEFICP